MKTPKMAGLATIAVVFVASLFLLTLASCSVTPSGPVSAGAAHGSLGSDNMCDYFYKKAAGWTYVYSNVQRIYATDNDDQLVSTLTGSNDTVRTMGFYSMAPNGDSIYRYIITYRIEAAFANRQELDIKYWTKSSTRPNGGFVDDGVTVEGMVTMGKKPRPVSTDTILAGLVGRIRTMTNDFTNTSQYVWRADTIWASEHMDTVLVWERPNGAANSLINSRVVFTKDFAKKLDWTYDLVWGITHIHVDDPNTTITVPAGTYPYTAVLDFTTPDQNDNMPIKEKKYYSFGIGNSYEYDSWYVTKDPKVKNRTMQDFTRSLVSLTH